jgi:hypothetical protein
MDDEKKIHHGYKLYWIWALKPLLVQDTINSNVFKSRYFFWIDIGCMRDATFFGRSLRSAPVQVRMMKDGVFFSLVDDFTDKELLTLHNGSSPLTWTPDRMSGAVWGGRTTAVSSFVNAYFKVFNRLADAGYFVGKDQTVMNIACIEHKRTLCIMVKNRWFMYNSWFYMVPFLLGDTDGAPYFLGNS